MNQWRNLTKLKHSRWIVKRMPFMSQVGFDCDLTPLGHPDIREVTSSWDGEGCKVELSMAHNAFSKFKRFVAYITLGSSNFAKL